MSHTPQRDRAVTEIKIITLDPGHFHAALVQKRMYPDVSKRVDVYAPLGFDLIEHLNRIARFNLRADDPTAWELEVHTGADFFERMLRERPGNAVVISGRNQGKIDRLEACVEAGLNVLADKPWIINSGDLSKLEAALNTADQKRIIAYDITEDTNGTIVLLLSALDGINRIRIGADADTRVTRVRGRESASCTASVPASGLGRVGSIPRR